MTAGLIGTVIAPDTVFRWSLYLLLALWPVPVFWAGRLFGLSRWTAAAAAAVSPFLASVPGIGYETKAYVWAGYGVWTQLCASWTLPLAWGFTYRALSSLRRRNLIPAVLFIMVTIALHYETGYLAVVPLVVWPFLVPSDLWRRLGRAVVVGAASFLASAWVVVPVLVQSHWAAKNQVLEGTGLENGYGARQILHWLFTGRMYDDGRFPVVTILLAVGIAVCIARWRSQHRRPRPGHHLVRHAPHDLRAHDLRRAVRRHPREQRRVHPPLPDGRAALRDSAGGGGGGLPRPMAARHRRPLASRGAPSTPVGTGRARVDQRHLRRRARGRARPGLGLPGLLRRAQRAQHRAAGRGRRASASPRSTA